ncbi:hypothetical protein AVME950_18310 [Acidovorax sp. SUPP950]|uniref:hypothetical protein n=1 Tax=Acidovorax sp. SUPP950 TaxID=511901 RepID=UPI0023C564B9|nr:hypothetical protein [Acidovorax sp. SUPP950]GKS76880.1 hypothetical protein AVME950_18310 [Acidovorax sp. SUPP950]
MVSIGGVWRSRAGAPWGLRKNRAVAGMMAMRVLESAVDALPDGADGFADVSYIRVAGRL